MRKTLISIFMMLTLCVNNSSAQLTLQGNDFVKVEHSSKRTSKKDTLVTKFTYPYNGQKCTVIINKASGSCYVWGKGRDGKMKRTYLKPEYSAIVAEKLGIEYKRNLRKK